MQLFSMTVNSESTLTTNDCRDLGKLYLNSNGSIQENKYTI